jgi:hypothetical protein
MAAYQEKQLLTALVCPDYRYSSSQLLEAEFCLACQLQELCPAQSLKQRELQQTVV